MSFDSEFTTEEMEIASKRCLERLKELSEAGEYTPEYYSMHRTLKNLEKRGLVMDFSGLSEEERTYLTKNCFSIPRTILGSFKSPMRFYYTGQHHYDELSEVLEGGVRYSSDDGRVEAIYNPMCYLAEYSIDDANLFPEEAIILVKTGCPEILSTMITYYTKIFKRSVVDMTIKHYVSLIEKEFGFYTPSDAYFLVENYLEIRSLKKSKETLEKEISELKSQVFHLQSHPPQQIQCPECKHEIEVCYDSTTEELKEHFKMVEALSHS